MKIRTKFVFAFLLLALTPVGVVSYFALNAVQEQMGETIGGNFQSLAKSKANAISRVLQAKVDQARILANRPLIRDALREANRRYAGRSDGEILASIARIDAAWIETDRKTPEVEQILNNELSKFLKDYYGDISEGIGETFLTDSRGAAVAMTKPLTDYYQADEGWWISGYNDGKGDIFIDDRGYDLSAQAIVVGVVAPVKDDGKVIGILKINFRVDDILSIVTSPQSDDPKENIALVRSQGTVIVDSKGKSDWTLTDADMLNINLPQEHWHEHVDVHGRTIKAHAPIQESIFTRNVGVGAKSEISGEEWQPTTWLVFIELDEEKAFSGIDIIRRHILIIGLTVTLIVIVLALWSARSLSEPILALREGAKIIGSGNLDHRVGIATNDEIGELSRTFDEMSTHLKEVLASRDDLNREVANRVDAEEQVRLLLDSTVEAIYGLDLQGNCIICNSSCFRMLGYEKPGDLLGRNMHALIHHTRPDGAPYPIEECIIERGVDKGESTHVDTEVFWRKDGTSFPVEYWSYPMRRGETIVGTVVTFLDITQRQEAEQERLRTQKMDSLGSLAGGVAHDINNMLLPILNLTPMVMRELPEDSPGLEKLDMVLKAAQRMKDMAARILAFSREDEGDTAEIDIFEIYNEAVDILRSTLPSTIKISTDLDPHVGKVKADPKQIEAILMNLASNAADAMAGETGEVAVSLSPVAVDHKLAQKIVGLKAGRYAKTVFADTGCGMDEETLKHIYDPLFTTKEKGKGTGLGMSMIFGTVTKYDGAIAVSSEVGKGTTFEIYLPLVEGA